MAWFTLLPVATNGFDGSEISKIRWPIHSNKVERVPQPCSNENYRRLPQRMFVVLFAFVFFTMQRIVANSGLPSVLKNVISSADRAVLEYGEAVIKSNW